MSRTSKEKAQIKQNAKMTAEILNMSDNMQTADNVPTADSEDYDNDIDSLSAPTSFQKDDTQPFSTSTQYSPSIGSFVGSTNLPTGSPPVRSLSMGSPIGSPLGSPVGSSPMGSPPLGSPIDSHVGSPIGSSIGLLWVLLPWALLPWALLCFNHP